MCNSPGSKRCYSTREEADEAAARHTFLEEARVYWCWLCEAFHITKRKYEKPRVGKKRRAA